MSEDVCDRNQRRVEENRAWLEYYRVSPPHKNPAWPGDVNARICILMRRVSSLELQVKTLEKRLERGP